MIVLALLWTAVLFCTGLSCIRTARKVDSPPLLLGGIFALFSSIFLGIFCYDKLFWH